MVPEKGLEGGELWPFGYPVNCIYEPGPKLWRGVPGFIRRNRLLLTLLAKFTHAWRPSLVKSCFRVNERIVEAPFVIRNVAEDDQRILDIGSCQSAVPLELAHLGFKVWALDQRMYPLRHPNLKFVQGDVCQLCFSANFFDVVVSLSTLEHVGLGYYGDARHPEGDRVAMRELWRVLKPKGKLILTAPYGKASETWQRVYDAPGLEALLGDFRVEKAQYYRKDGEAWLEAAPCELGNIDSSTQARAVVLVVARKP